jgi:hypothetical protein
LRAERKVVNKTLVSFTSVISTSEKFRPGQKAHRESIIVIKYVIENKVIK